MLKLILIGATLAGFHGTPAHQHRYWWMSTANCTISTAIYRNTGTLRGTPYITCTGASSHWGTTPQTINPADAVAGCGYQDAICKP
jgi:hypothetical protein